MAEIDLTPTEEMAANAARGLELRRKHGKGGTEIGVARARDISNRKNLSPETVRRMHAFFSRHEKNKAGGEDDAGYIAWLLWGGDSGQSWAKRKVEQMNKGENQRSDTYKEIAQRLGSAAKHARPGAKAKFGLLTSVSTLPNTGSVNNTAKRFLERLQRVNLNDYEGFESFHRNLSEALAGVVRNTNKSLKNHEYGEWTGKDLAAILQREMGRSAALTRTAEAWLGVSMMSRPGAKAKMGNAEDVRSLLAQAEQMIWTAKRPEQKREVMELVKDAERMIDASMPSGFRMRLDRLKQRIASEFSRFGVKVKMAMTPIRVTEAEYAALAARDAVSRKILGDSQYQITPSDRAIRAAGDAAYKTALARHNAWHKAWLDAPNDAARAEVEARAKAAEAGMRVYRGSRPGAKAKFMRFIDVLSWPGEHGSTYEAVISDDAGRFQPSVTRRDRDGSEQYLTRYAPTFKTEAGARKWLQAKIAEMKAQHRASRPGAKAKMGREKTVTVATVMSGTGGSGGLFKVVGYDENGREFEYGLFAMRSMAEQRAKDVARWKDWKYTASRPGAKAKMATQKVARFRVGKDLSGGYSVVPIKADGNVETSVYEEIGFRHSFPTADAALAKAKQMQAKYGGTVTMEDKQVSSRPGAKAKMATEGRVKVDGVEYRVLPYQVEYFKSDLAKFDDPKWRKQVVQQYLAKNYIVRASRPGAKAKMANHIRTVAEDKEASRRGLRRMIDQLESEWQSLNNQPSKAGRIPRMETIKKQIAGLEERLKSLSSRPGAKAKFAFKVGDRVHAGFGVAGGAGVIGTITKIEDGYAHIQGDASVSDRYGAKTYKAPLRLVTAAPKKAWESSKNAVREGEKVSAADDAVSRKIRKLMDEGKPQKQAVAIALDLERRGEL